MNQPFIESEFAIGAIAAATTDVELNGPPPADSAGAAVATAGGYKHATNPRPIVLVNQGGHGLITQHTALDAIWYAAFRTVEGKFSARLASLVRVDPGH